MKLNATKLRANLYKILDQVIKTGVPVEVERHGKKIRVVLASERSKLDNLEAHTDCIVGDLDEFVHMDWSPYWKYEE